MLDVFLSILWGLRNKCLRVRNDNIICDGRYKGPGTSMSHSDVFYSLRGRGAVELVTLPESLRHHFVDEGGQRRWRRRKRKPKVFRSVSQQPHELHGVQLQIYGRHYES